MTRTLRLAAPALALLLAAPAAAQKVSGRVQPPVADARVELLPWVADYRQAVRWLQGDTAPVATARPRPDGSFEIAAPEPGFYWIRLQAPGSAPMEHPILPLFEDTELPPLQTRPGQTVEVRVVDPEGKPVPGTPVRLVDSTQGNNLPAWLPAAGLGVTGPDGKLTVRSGSAALVVQTLSPRFPWAEAETRGNAVTVRLAAPQRQAELEVRDRRGKPVAGALIRRGQETMMAPVGLTGADGRWKMALAGTETVDLLVEAEDGRSATVTVRARDVVEGRPLVVELSPPAVVAGRVLSAAGRTPLPGALVWIDSLLHRPARSAADGGFRLSLPPGRSRGSLEAAAAGHLRTHGEAAPRSDTGQTEVTLLLEPAAVIAGMVVDPEGRPVAGAEIEGKPAGDRRSSSYPEWERQTRSGADGRFRLPRLTPGETYEVQARRDGFAPGSALAAAALPGAAAAPVRLVLSRGRTVFGRLVDEDERPVAGARVRLLPSSNPPRPWTGTPKGPEASTDAEGRFELRHLPAGRFDLAARHPKLLPAYLPGLEVPAEPGRQDLGVLTLAPGAVLEGRVTGRRGSPVVGANVSAFETENILFWIDEDSSVTTGADGRFRIEGLRPGRLRVSARAQGYSPHSLENVEVPSSEPLRIELRASGSLAGRVVGPRGEPVADAALSRITRQAGGVGSSLAARTDSRGLFRIEDMPPGAVELEVRAEGYKDQTWLGEVPEGGEAGPVEIALESGAVLEGRVFDERREPLPGVTVWAFPEKPPQVQNPLSAIAARTDGEGRYVLNGLDTGPHEIRAVGEEDQKTSVRVDIQPGTQSQDLTLSLGVEVSGSVLDEAGTPIPGAAVTLTVLQEGQGGSPLETVTAPDGSFRFPRVPAGTGYLRASRQGFTPAQQKVEVVEPVRGLDLRLGRGGAIVGRLLGVEPHELMGAYISGYSPGQPSASGRAEGNGRYRLPDLAPGEWRVNASLRSGRRAEGTVRLEPGAAEAVLDLDLTGDLTLTGRLLLDGAPMARMSVALSSTEGHGGSTQTEADGTFRIPRVPFGRYVLNVANPFGLSLQRPVELAENQEVAFEAVTGNVQGRLLSAGEPVAGAFLVLEGAAGEWTVAHRVQTDAEGSFQLRAIAGSYQMRLQVAPGPAQDHGPVQVPPGQTVRVTIEIEPASR